MSAQPSIIRLSLSSVEATSRNRPKGYLQDVISNGEIRDGLVFIQEDRYWKLVDKYGNYRTKQSEGETVSVHLQPLPAGRRPAGRPPIVANALGAAFRMAKATMKGEKVRASESEIDRRLAICRACEHFVDNPMKCRKCGCFLNLKTRLETEHCPLPIPKW